MISQKKRRISAIMFTDIVGYTALMQKDENAAVDIRERHRKEFKKQHENHNGKVVQYYGDGTLSVFTSGVEAVECAIAIQKALQKDKPLPLRIGLHLGDIVYDGTEVYGDGVNLASRIESQGIAGSILLSSKLNDEIKNQTHISTLPLGSFKLKNIAKPIEIFAVEAEGINVPDSSFPKNVLLKKNNTIAVLPFVNMSSDVDKEYFSDGMTEEIINALAHIKGLKVTSRTSSFHFKNKNIPISKIGRELNVSTILEGSIRLSGSKMRITAQLIDVADDIHFWSKTFDRSTDDIFAVQDEISLLIAEKLREHIGHIEIEDKLVEPLNVSVEIYREYLKGRYYLMKLDYESTIKSISIFEGIIEKEPNFANPYLDINQGYTYMGAMGLLPAFEAFQKAQPYLQKALELNPNSSRSQLNLSWIACWQNWDLKKAYQHANKALEIQPADDIYLTISNYLTVEGKLDSAQNYVNKALELDPFSAMNHHYKGYLYYLQQDYESAIPYLQKALELNPILPFSPICIGFSLLLSGKPHEALGYFNTLKGISIKDLTKLGGITMCYALLRDISRCNDGIKELETYLVSELVEKALFYLILVNALLGNHDKVLDFIEQAYNNHLPLVLLLNSEPILKPIRNDERFKKIMTHAISDNNNYTPKKRYKQSLLKKVEIDTYVKELEKIMMDYKLYLNPDLSLKDLASYLELPANYVSQLLNQGFNKNFSEYVNTFRIKEFKERVVLEENKSLTIMAVAYDSGFNSKTVFNTFFKKTEGITPNTFLKNTSRN
jgi:TolB-like protein/AraC-like DNA-binding protein